MDNFRKTPGSGHDAPVTDRLGDPSSAPRARRLSGPGWRDPRIVLGLVVLAGSVVLGATLLDDADDTVPVWAVSTDLAAGQPVSDQDLEVRQVRFPDAVAADRYLSAADPLPADATLARAVGAGELLPRAALGAAETARLVEVPVSAATDAVPGSVRAGSVVDVWVVAEAAVTSAAGEAPAGAERVLDDVVVLAAPRPEDGLAPSGNRQLVVGVPADQLDGLPVALAGTGRGTVVVTREP